jgi:hypothetical protein
VTQFVLIVSAGLREPEAKSEAGRKSRISIPSPNSSHCRRPVFDKGHLAQQSLALSISQVDGHCRFAAADEACLPRERKLGS